MRKAFTFFGILALIILSVIVIGFKMFANDNYSNGKHVGMLTKFSREGRWENFKSWEGHLNITQTGMNQSTGWDFSIDNDNEPPGVVKTLDSAQNDGWLVELSYHETKGYNWFNNRGNTDFFVTSVNVLDKHPNIYGGDRGKANGNVEPTGNSGNVISIPVDGVSTKIDTIIVIYKPRK